VPSADFINSFNPIWHDYHWLGQLAMYGLYSLGGYRLLAVGLAALMTSLFLLLGVIIRANRAACRSAAVASLFLLYSAALLSQIAQMRPQMIALAALAGGTSILLGAPRRWELPVLFALTAVVANLHVYWIFFPILWFSYRCVPRMFRTRGISGAEAWGGLVLLSSAAFLSPYGIFLQGKGMPGVLMNYALLYEYLDVPSVLRSTVGEFRSTFAMPGPGFYLLLAALVLFLRNLRPRRLLARPGSALLGVATFCLAARSAKYVGLFAILGLPLLLDTQAAFVARFLARADLTLGGKRGTRAAVAAAITAALVALWPGGMPNDRAALAEIYPLGACEALPSLKLAPRAGRDHPRVLTHFDFGGWCRWFAFQKSPDVDLRVTTDNRTQGVPGEFYTASLDLYFLRHDWLRTLQQWAPDAAIVRKDFPLAQFLALARDRWTLRYEDETWAVFTPRE
jgi:hypothetical protein